MMSCMIAVPCGVKTHRRGTDQWPMTVRCSMEIMRRSMSQRKTLIGSAPASIESCALSLVGSRGGDRHCCAAASATTLHADHGFPYLVPS
jgi:hypothetical protein